MGAACSAGAMGGRISSEEYSENQKMELKPKTKLKTARSFGRLRKNNWKPSNPQPPSSATSESAGSRFSFSGDFNSSSPRLSGDDKIPQKGSFLGRTSFAGLEKAVDVLDALGSGMANLNSSGFLTGKVAKGNKISILAFEVANTITRGANVMNSLSEENVKFIKEEVIPSEGVQHLVSTNMKVLLSLAASDKREELYIFCKEVVRFGNLCKDPQWHNLDRFFAKLDSENAVYRQQREQAQAKMDELISLAQHTSELYHELNAFDRFEQDYRQKVDEMKSLNLPRKGEHLMILHDELRQQKKIVMALKRKSLWSRKLEEVVEKLVDIVCFIHQEILEVFGTGGVKASENVDTSTQRLGSAGLALHYANIINQIDNIASRPTSLPPTIRDTLYHGLPTSVKTALRSSLRKLNPKNQTDVPQTKAEMERILEWLSPMAANTLKGHQGFGWVGEWANASIDFNKNSAGNGNLIRLQTLYHADKEKMDSCILKLVTLLHRLISGVKRQDYGLRTLPLQSPSKKILLLHSAMKKFPSPYDGSKALRVELSEEEQVLLERISMRKLIPGISKSQEFAKNGQKMSKSWRWSRSMESSPYKESTKTLHPELLDGDEFHMRSGGLEAPF